MSAKSVLRAPRVQSYSEYVGTAILKSFTDKAGNVIQVFGKVTAVLQDGPPFKIPHNPFGITFRDRDLDTTGGVKELWISEDELLETLQAVKQEGTGKTPRAQRAKGGKRKAAALGVSTPVAAGAEGVAGGNTDQRMIPSCATTQKKQARSKEDLEEAIETATDLHAEELARRGDAGDARRLGIQAKHDARMAREAERMARDAAAAQLKQVKASHKEELASYKQRQKDEEAQFKAGLKAALAAQRAGTALPA